MELVPSIGKASVENSLKKLTEEGVIKKHGKGKANSTPEMIRIIVEVFIVYS